MRREERRRGGIGPQFAVHLFRHVYETVHGRKEIAVERPVGKVAFVRFDIVDLAQHFRMSVAAGEAGDRPEAGRHEGRPVFQQHEIGPFAADRAPHGQPVQRIHRIDAPPDAQVGGRRRRHGLALAGKQQRGILQREGLDVHVVAPPQESAGHDLQNRGQTAPVGVCGTQYGNFHRLRIRPRRRFPSGTRNPPQTVFRSQI